MPIYEYQCQKCHHHLEALQKIADKPLRECPECGRHALKRLVSAPLFRLAGSGWYETDFKSDKETKRNLAGREESPSEPAKETSKDAGGEAPAATTEPRPEKPDTPAVRKTVVAKPAAKASPAPRAPGRKPVAAKKAARKAGRKR